MHSLPMKMKRRGQMFTWDMIFGLVLFLLTFGITISIWETSYTELRLSEEGYEMTWLVETVGDQLVRTGGDPPYWSRDNVITYGLTEERGAYGESESRIIDADKLLMLLQDIRSNYTKVRNKLLGSGTYELYLEVSCLNSTSLACLHGIPLQTVTETVSCNNQRIYVNKPMRMTNSYEWYEAEDLWGNHDDSQCSRGCSGGNMSAVHQVPDAHMPSKKGRHYIWARVLGNPGATASIFIDHKAYRLYAGTSNGIIDWKYLGEQDLGYDVLIGFNDTAVGDRVDTLLLTTDKSYDPRRDNAANYGNPSIGEPCEAGLKPVGGEVHTVMKTGIIGLPPTALERLTGAEAVGDGIVQLRVVVWGGRERTARDSGVPTTMTTTTTLRTAIDCIPIADPDMCVSNKPSVLLMEDTILWGAGGPEYALQCGSSRDVTINWAGNHGGSPNYFAFFVDNGSFMVGKCSSDVPPNEIPPNDPNGNYEYEMNCTLTPDASDLPLPDGPHKLIVMAENEGGFCYPENSSYDDRMDVDIDLTGCISYAGITCNKWTEAYLPPPGCDNRFDSVRDIHSLDVAGGPLRTGMADTVTVKWEGDHGADRQVQWTFLLRQGGAYDTIGHCYSNVAADDTGAVNYYTMDCAVDTPAAVDCEQAYLYSVAETNDNRYCADPDDPDAEAVDSIDVLVDGCHSCDEETETAFSGDRISIECPSGQTITQILRADYVPETSGVGCPDGGVDGACHYDCRLDYPTTNCLGQPDCEFDVSDAACGNNDPCPATLKKLVLKVECG